MRSPHVASYFICILILVLSNPAFSYHPGPQQLPLHENVNTNPSSFDKTIISFMQERSIPGLSLAITKDDRLVYASGYGYADKALHTPVSVRDRFRLASVSKTVTAITIMHLVESGYLSLFDTVFGDSGILGSKYSNKPFNGDERNITVQDLLQHTSGFVNEDMCGKDCDPTYLAKWLDLDQWQLIRAILDVYSPSHAPGTFASYSNFGYFILGRVVEEVTGVVPYGHYVRDAILRPLLNITAMEIATDERRENEVVYYDFEEPDGPYTFHVSRRDSVGAWIATPTDLARMMTAVDGLAQRPNILNETTRALMFQKTGVDVSNYAKGWTVSLDSDGALVEAEKDGDYSGTNSFISLKFKKRVSYAVVVNKEIPSDGKFHNARDLKTLMDGVVDGIREWPQRDLFDDEVATQDFNSWIAIDPD
jgi:CubicO group peptidase (beta-lactamase class C family)